MPERVIVLPDGTKHRFPEGTSDAEVSAALAGQEAPQREPTNVRNFTDRLGRAISDTVIDLGHGARDMAPLLGGMAATAATGGAALLPTIALTGLGGAAGSFIRRGLGGGDSSVDPATEAAQSFVGQAAPVATIRGLTSAAPAVQKFAGKVWDRAAGASPGTGAQVLPTGRGMLTQSNTAAIQAEKEATTPVTEELNRNWMSEPGATGPTTTQVAGESPMADIASSHMKGTMNSGGQIKAVTDVAYGAGGGGVFGHYIPHMGGAGPIIGAGIGAAKNPIIASGAAQAAHSGVGAIASHPTEAAMIAQMIREQIANLLGGNKQPQPVR